VSAGAVPQECILWSTAAGSSHMRTPAAASDGVGGGCGDCGRTPSSQSELDVHGRIAVRGRCARLCA
jgi:hypothetical protein